jgi:hypothetical protein
MEAAQLDSPPTAGTSGPSARLPVPALSAACALLACVPVLVSVVRAIAADWIPVGDRAIIAARAYDVFSAHPPLLGQYSAVSGALANQTHSLGPMLYWVLAIPAHLFGAWAFSVSMGLLSALCITGAVVLAHRRGGAPLMVATALALLLVTASLPAEVLHDSWNPSAGVLPLALLLFLGWSLACGEIGLLPLAALVASFVVQCHLTFVPPTLGILAVAAAGLTARGAWRRRPALGAAAVAAVCWVLPAVDQVIHSPGNFLTVLRSIGNQGPTLGVSAGWRAVTHAIGVPPWWLRARGSVGDRLFDLFHSAPALGTLTAVLVLAGLTGLIVAATRQRRGEVLAAAAIALLVVLALGSVAASTPRGHLLFLTLGYTTWWGSVAGMWAWLVLVWGVLVLAPAGRVRRLRQAVRAPARPRALAATALAGLALAALLVSAAQHVDLNRAEYRPLGMLTARLVRALPTDGTVDIERSTQGFATYDIETGLLYQLRRRGRRVVSADLAQLLGTRYRAAGARPTVRLVVVAGGKGSSTATRGVVSSAMVPGAGLVAVGEQRTG